MRLIPAVAECIRKLKDLWPRSWAKRANQASPVKALPSLGYHPAFGVFPAPVISPGFHGALE